MQWSESPDEQESLAVALRALLAGRGARPPAYDELIGVLGLGSAMVAAPGECLGWWWTHLRDRALPAAAELYGLRLRGLHPPTVALGLDGAVEFAQHFSDSYLPLIRDALAHGERLLAWRGWPPPADRDWGLIVALRDERPVGYTRGTGGRTVPLIGPAYQVYVVEGVQPATPLPASELFQRGVRAAAAFWSASDLPEAPVRTGRQAYARWRGALADPPACPLCVERSHRCVARLARAVCSARRQQCAWLSRISAELDSAGRAQAEGWAAAGRDVASRLGRLQSAEAVQALLACPAGRRELASAVQTACAAESRLIESLAAG